MLLLVLPFIIALYIFIVMLGIAVIASLVLLIISLYKTKTLTEGAPKYAHYKKLTKISGIVLAISACLFILSCMLLLL